MQGFIMSIIMGGFEKNCDYYGTTHKIKILKYITKFDQVNVKFWRISCWIGKFCYDTPQNSYSLIF